MARGEAQGGPHRLCLTPCPAPTADPCPGTGIKRVTQKVSKADPFEFFYSTTAHRFHPLVNDGAVGHSFSWEFAVRFHWPRVRNGKQTRRKPGSFLFFFFFFFFFCRALAFGFEIRGRWLIFGSWSLRRRSSGQRIFRDRGLRLATHTHTHTHTLGQFSRPRRQILWSGGLGRLGLI